MIDTENAGQVTPGYWRQDADMSSLINLRRLPRKPGKTAKDIQNEFANYFVSNGAVPWQHKYC